ncbi:hypothetical protein hamaS1_08590 [Moorella sp. Hama-1]|nr:hypothetical protein [Moorella sp. Hama-1]BCV20790.1 hypothetical protein hamaS1_08590 [Moorella sp. Hama-1]
MKFKMQPLNLAGSIVNGTVQSKLRAALLQPGKRAGVDLRKQALLGQTVTRLLAFGQPVGMGQRNTSLLQDPAHGLSRKGGTIELFQELSYLLAASITKRALGQHDHLFSSFFRRSLLGRPTSVFMSQARNTFSLHPLLQADYLAFT